MQRLFFVFVLSMPLPSKAEWVPPANPDPKAVIHQAYVDGREGRHEDALAKHIWFHKHALEFEPTLIGVRLGPALTGWYDLGKVYPPALKKFKKTRDEATKQVIEANGDTVQAFSDLSSFNELLGDESETARVFVKLDDERPKIARKVYDWAQPALIKAEAFALCGKYVDTKPTYAQLLKKRRWSLENIRKIKSPEEQRAIRKVIEKGFLENAATLVALLTLNERRSEAEETAKDILNVSHHVARKAVIDAALQGKLPRIK